MSQLQSLSVLERPAVVRDRAHILKAVKLALVKFAWEIYLNPEGRLEDVSADFLRELQASGVEVRKSRRVRP